MITGFVDVSRGALKNIQRYHTCYVIFLNNVPILWYSRKQSAVEANALYYDFIALKT